MSDFIPWVEKYRPAKLADMIGHADITKRLEQFVKNKSMPHLLLAGPPGTGKTASVLAMARELYGESVKQAFLEFNASDERGIDVVRGNIKDFARTLALGDVSFKIIFLDEADALTQDAQQALRRTMERYSSNTRFILNCNYSSRIIEPIQSRCAVFRFSRLTSEEIKQIVQNIAKHENLKIDEKAVDAVVYVADGDARKAINVLQGAAHAGHVKEEDVFKVSSRAKPEELSRMVSVALKGKFLEARALLDTLMIKYGMSGEDVLQQIYPEIVNSTEITEQAKIHLVDRVGEYDFRISEGASERMQLEALLAQLVLAGKKQ